MEKHTGLCFLTTILTVIILMKSALSLQNVALGKPATQSGTYKDFGAGRAVDGNQDQHMFPNTESDGTSVGGSCAHPQTSAEDVEPEDRDEAAWWMVDLQDEYDVYGVNIHNRGAHQERLSNSVVLVSNEKRPDINIPNICKDITDGNFAVINVDCDYDSPRKYLRGRYVMIKRRDYAGDRKNMNFCEVEVLSCPIRKWGLSLTGNCTQDCGKCNQNTCTVSNGHCVTSCQDGWFGDKCDEKCHCSRCDRYNRSCGSFDCEEGFGGYQHCTIALPKTNKPTVAYEPNKDSVTITFTILKKLEAPYSIKFYKIVVQELSSGYRNTLPDEVGWTQSNSIKLDNATSKLPLGKGIRFRVIPVFSDSGENIYGSESDLSEEIVVQEPTSMNVGLIAGIVVAVIVLIILIIVVVFLIIRYRKSGTNMTEKKREVLIVSSQPTTPDYAYENPVVGKQNGDTLQSVKVDDPKYEIPTRIPVVNGIIKPASGSQTPELLPSEDEEEQIYDNPMKIPPIKISELSSYIEKRKGETDAFKKEYQQLPAGDKAKWETGNKVENRNKNRFVNIRAYDHSRVVLSIEDGDIHSDYINADFITGYKDKPKVYVAAQGPKKCTVVDTWRMIWELNANRIVMVTNLVEGGKPKCEKYWPDTEEQYGQYKVVTTSNEVFADYSIKLFKLTHKDETRTVHHLHFTSWPDHGVPITATALLNFRRKVRSYDDVAIGPMVVHCSAGVGRTGTFIALDTLLEQAKNEEEVDVYGYACVMRSNRVNMIQTLEQYIFVYDGLLEALLSGDTSIPCPELATTYEDMKKINPETNQSKLQDQFDVLEVLKPAKKEEKFTALEPQNKDKNRDVEIVPSNRFRPFLSIKVEGCTDYINAIYVDGYRMRLAYIITQSPLPNTIKDMWRLAYDHASRTIVMLNQLSDDDDDCPVYWPKDKESPLVFEPLTVTLVDEKVDSVTPSITVRDFSIVHSGKPNNPVIVKQFHLTNWKDGETLPESTKDLLDVMDLIERWQQQSGNGPVTIHCRNGCDKSTLYCAASYTVEKLKLDREVDVFHAVKHVRVCRVAAVPTMEHYMYLHELALEYLDKFEIYANFK